MIGAEFKNEKGEITQSFTCDEDIILDLTFLVKKKVPGVYGYFSFNRAADESPVWISDSNDIRQNKLEELPLGESTVRLRFPKRTIAPGQFVAFFNFTSHSSAGGFQVDGPGNVAKIDVQDFSTWRGNFRQGGISTLVDWEF